MSKKQKKAIRKILHHWRQLLYWKTRVSSDYSKGCFTGAWAIMSNKGRSYLFGKLNQNEREIITHYPIDI